MLEKTHMYTAQKQRQKQKPTIYDKDGATIFIEGKARNEISLHLPISIVYSVKYATVDRHGYTHQCLHLYECCAYTLTYVLRLHAS